MKKFLKICLCACLCFVSLAFTACGGKNKIEAPASDAIVLDNGGIVVQKGDFVYFGNGYKSLDDITTKSQVEKSWSLGGLYVAKSNDNTFDRTENGSLTSMSRLSALLSSFEATDLHVFGNYMYYTTINTEVTKNGSLQKNELQVYRVKLDGTGSKRVYKSNVDFEDSEGNRVVDFNYFEEDGNVYILIRENETLKRVKCSSSEISSATTIATDVLSYKVSSDKEDVSQIFYTKINDDGNYEIVRYDIKKDQTIANVELNSGDEISSLFDVKFNRVYFYATFEDVGSEFLYSLTFDNIANKDSVVANVKKLTKKSYTSLYLLNSYSDGILALSSSKVEIINQQNTSDIEDQDNMPTDATIISVEDGYVYYFKDKAISRWDYVNDEVYLIFTEENAICNYAFDVVGDYLYYYSTVNSNDYLFRVKISGVVEEKESEIIGVYKAEDAPVVEEETTDTEEE